MNKTAVIKKVIKENRSFVITAHNNLDGDSLGAGTALALALRSMGKNAEFLLNTPVPEQYRFLPGIKSTAHKRINIKKRCNVLFVIDTAGWEQMSRISPPQFKKYTIINIDHHADNTRFGTINWVDTKAGAAGELIYALIKSLNVKITEDIASCLYTSIVTDTGRFQFSNTTPFSHRITASLIEKGARPERISEEIYEKIPYARLKLLRYASAGIMRGYRGQIVWMRITQEMLKKAGAKTEDTEGFIDILRSVRGIRAAVVFKELPGKKAVKAALRAKGGGIHVNAVARIFGGGGHPAAAGCTIEGTARYAEKKLINALMNEIKKNGRNNNNR